MTEGNVNKTAHRILKLEKKVQMRSHPAFKDSNAEINIFLWTKKVKKILYFFSNSRPLCGFYHFEMIDVWLEKDWHGMLFLARTFKISLIPILITE